MANPQPDKYTKISNELLEQVPRFKLNGSQFRIILVIWRYTYGFRRKDSDLSLSYISEATGMAKRQVEREMTTLINRNIVNIRTESSGRRSRILGFNKDYDTWKEDVAPTNQYAQIDMFSTDYLDGSAPTNPSVLDGRSTDYLVHQERKVLKKGFKERKELFETFYILYPRKLKKAYANQTWEKHCKDESFDPDLVINNTRNYADTCKLLGTDMKFVPHASTYLNQKVYEDYPVLDPEGLAKGKDKLSDNLDFLRQQMEGRDDGERGQLTSGESISSLPE